MRILTNGKLRAYVAGDGRGGLFYDWVALTRFLEGAPEGCGPMVYVSEGGERQPDDLSVEIVAGIAPGVDVEVRRITVANSAGRARVLELTTYAEVALNHPLGDAGHPAFSKLFVQTSIAGGDCPVLLARRRPRGRNENWPWLAQALIGEGVACSWETNRASFLGRGRTPADPAAMDRAGALSGETGNVLDPVMAWRTELTVAANSSVTLWLLTAAAADEAGVLELLAGCQAEGSAARMWDAAQASERVRREAHGLDETTARRYEALGAQMLLGRHDRVVPGSLAGAGVVHRYPLGGDELRVIAQAGWSAEGTQDLIRALPFWQALGLRVRTFVMDPSVREFLPEGVALVDPEGFTADEHSWWLASAQLIAGEEVVTAAPRVEGPAQVVRSTVSAAAEPGEALRHFNGHGGFSADGREYVIPLALESGRLGLPPMPWVNVLANSEFGCIVSERGAGYTWSRNSQANRLTPWSNDPVSDPFGEAFYLRDEESGEVWSPLPGPCPAQSAFVVRHGFGRTRFASRVSDLEQVVEFLVPPDEPVKLVSIRLENHGAARQLSFAAFHRLMLCSTPDRHHATLAWTDAKGVQHAVNPRAGDFAGGRAFSFVAVHGAAVHGVVSNHSIAAFVGAGGLASPAALGSAGAWSNAGGFGRDACFSRKLSFELAAGAQLEIVVGLGEVMEAEKAEALVARFSAAGAMAATGTDEHWARVLGGVRVRTPLPEIDVMVNGWLLYQNLACRIWGRSAFYQSGGAFGFRDQLQDSGALAALHPELMRAQILLHAAQQFPEGDVTHWWHPAPMARGMRTKFSDDLLWLPYLTDHYVEVTGDAGVLDEMLPFIEGPLLGADEDEEYMQPAISERQASVYEHCCLALDKSLTKGAHGLPLMGIGDWNDGMSRIGRQGRGESVWMGFFLITILEKWIPLCARRGQAQRAERYAQYRADMLEAVNAAGWDGEWYRRAYYDDGTPLGTRNDSECRIDALAQAWAVISKAASAQRAGQSLDALQRELVDSEHDLIRLLHPPFIDTPNDPGYIKGYVAGVRENGGQYTHAACWVVRAMAEAGRRDDAARLLQRLSPVWHSRDAAAVARYQVEPYVVAADIYGAPPHVGRGGWTWYTGSAGWLFRVAVESVFGLRVENGDTLVLDPRVPDTWPGFAIEFRTPSGRTLYRIDVAIPGKAERASFLTVDGQALEVRDGIARWAMVDDGKEHEVRVVCC
jgi:cellobiose phosphorylase